VQNDTKFGKLHARDERVVLVLDGAVQQLRDLRVQLAVDFLR
jgi:hypothetical protein